MRTAGREAPATRPSVVRAVAGAARDARAGWTARSTLAVLALAAVAIAPLVVSDPLDQAHLAAAVYLAVAAAGLNVAIGFAGIPSLGQGAFVAVGAFGTALLHARAGWDPLAAVAGGTAAASAAGVVVAAVAARLSGGFVAAATWLVTWVVAFVLSSFPAISGGSQGIVMLDPTTGVPLTGIRITLTPAIHVELAVLVLAVVLAALGAVRRGAPGLALAVIREEPGLAESLGIDVPRLRFGAMLTSASIGGLAGSMGVLLAQVADPTAYGPLLSVELFAAVLLGGPGSLYGPALGAAVLALIPTAARSLGSVGGDPGRFDPVIAALLLLAALLVRRPRGTSSWTSRWPRRPVPDVPQDAGLVPAVPAGGTGNATAPALQARGVSIAFGGVQALSEVDLSIAPGQIHALIGPNGSGKTTLLRVLAGAVRPDAGSVELAGQDVTGTPVRRRVRGGVVRTIQRTTIAPGLPALEHLAAGSAIHRRLGGAFRTALATPRARGERDERLRAALALLRRAGLDRRADVPVGHLTGAEQRSVAVLTALATEPDVLLLDEPTAGLRPLEAADLIALLDALREDGLSIVLVEHNMRAVMSLADRVTVLDAGRVIASGSPREVAADPEVRRAYLGS